MALVYLASTRCHDLTTELLLVAQKLPSDKLLLFFSRVQPLSLASHLAENVPELKEMYAQFSGLFCPNKNEAAHNIFKPPNSTSQTRLSPGRDQEVCVDDEKETTECTPSILSQSQPSSNPTAKASQPINETGLQAQFNGMQVQQSSTANLSSQEQGGTKQVAPFIMNTNRRLPANKQFLVAGTSKSRVVAQVLYRCENCRNGTCPRCIQTRSIPIHNSYCKK